MSAHLETRAPTELQNSNVNLDTVFRECARVLRPGDRVEIYRELVNDPREARRRRAALESRTRRPG
jgi:putative ubiquitin-RnfH superfamily antitoxin RatB of RatAB toxin-antitoxin module